VCTQRGEDRRRRTSGPSDLAGIKDFYPLLSAQRSSVSRPQSGAKARRMNQPTVPCSGIRASTLLATSCSTKALLAVRSEPNEPPPCELALRAHQNRRMRGALDAWFIGRHLALPLWLSHFGRPRLLCPVALALSLPRPRAQGPLKRQESHQAHPDSTTSHGEPTDCQSPHFRERAAVSDSQLALCGVGVGGPQSWLQVPARPVLVGRDAVPSRCISSWSCR